MSAGLSTSSSSRGDPADACGLVGGRPWRFWPLIPLVILGVIASLLLLAWATGVTPRAPGGAPFFWPLFPLGFLLAGLVVFLAFRWAFWGGGGRYGPVWWSEPPAEELLRLRFVRGEITAEQFHRMQDDLERR
jgi:uncharacterized membrane protein